MLLTVISAVFDEVAFCKGWRFVTGANKYRMGQWYATGEVIGGNTIIEPALTVLPAESCVSIADCIKACMLWLPCGICGACRAVKGACLICMQEFELCQQCVCPQAGKPATCDSCMDNAVSIANAA